MSVLRSIRCNPQVLCRHLIARSSSSLTDGETRITQVLKVKFPQASLLKVVDISGGCGAMYEIHIESDEFRGKRTVQQHQLVNQYCVAFCAKPVKVATQVSLRLV
uniref:BolA-like protein 3 n=1 Tax=Sinocyclocheilus rhinocerous TaxID=307959 RepID=A0A673FZQ8_9TELE